MNSFYLIIVVCIRAKRRKALVAGVGRTNSGGDEKVGLAKITVDSKTLLDYSLGT